MARWRWRNINNSGGLSSLKWMSARPNEENIDLHVAHKKNTHCNEQTGDVSVFSRLFFCKNIGSSLKLGHAKTRKSFIPLLSDGDRGQDLGAVTQVEGFSLYRHTEVTFFSYCQRIPWEVKKHQWHLFSSVISFPDYEERLIRLWYALLVFFQWVYLESESWRLEGSKGTWNDGSQEDGCVGKWMLGQRAAVCGLPYGSIQEV